MFKIIIILILILSYYKLSYREKIENNLFMMKNDSYKVYNNNPYLNKLNPINLKARNISLDDYNQSFKNLTIAEKQIMMKLIKNNDIYKYLKKYNVKLACSDIEDSLPHTLKNVIILPASFFNLFRISDYTKTSTLFHELCHVLQRKKEKDYEKLYNKWGFKKVHNLIDENNVLKKNRTNPDGLKLNWVWRNKYIIFAEFYNDSPHSLRDVSHVYYVIKNNKITNEKGYLKDLEEFNNFFGYILNNYHPNEICANYFEFFFLNNNFDSPGYEILKNNINNII